MTKARWMNRAREDPNKSQRNRNNGTREINGQIRQTQAGEDGHRFILSFSSEEPCQRWFGNEILDHGEEAVDLSRLTDMGVVLFNHNRDIVIGKIIRAWLDKGRGYAEMEFDSDEQSEVIRQKTAGGTLKGVSVGYRVDRWEEVTGGNDSEDGRFKGPCSIARRWTPYEISIVSIPADATVGVGRMEESGQSMTETYKRQLIYNQNLARR